jgi:hypothetical protein
MASHTLTSGGDLQGVSTDLYTVVIDRLSTSATAIAVFGQARFHSRVMVRLGIVADR